MLPRILWLGCRLAPLCVALAGCALLWPEPEMVEPAAAPVVPPDVTPPQLPVIFFPAAGDSLDIGAREKIEMIAAIAKDPRWRDLAILVEGHSDSEGDPDDNRELAQRRAELVTSELVFANVARDRIIVQTAGAEQPLAPNQHADGSDNPDGRALNRRVEVRLLILPAASE